jgi:hypothetical protein
MIGKLLIVLFGITLASVIAVIFAFGFQTGQHRTEKRIGAHWYDRCMGLHHDSSFCDYEFEHQLGFERNK